MSDRFVSELVHDRICDHCGYQLPCNPTTIGWLCRPCLDILRAFNEDMIARSDLPKDAHQLIHDLAYHHDGRNICDYVTRAQVILKTPNSDIIPDIGAELQKALDTRNETVEKNP